VYHASKWAITGFTKCLQEDFDTENIKVTGIYPGMINTKLFEKGGIDKDLTNSLDPEKIADVVSYVINLDSGVHIPEIGIKNKLTASNMDNSSSPTIDLNIDPNMIAAQDDTPQVASPIQAPVTPIMPVRNPGVIDITPGSTDVFPSDTPTTHIGMDPIPQTTTSESVPQTPVSDSLSHLSDITPEPAGEPIPDEPSPVTPEPVAAPVIEPTVDPLPVQTPVMPVVSEPVPQAPVQTSVVSPLAEDPDLVKLVK